MERPSTRSDDGVAGNSPYQSAPRPAPNGKEDTAACCATADAKIGPNDTAPGVSLPSAKAPVLRFSIAVATSAAAARVTAYSASVRSRRRRTSRSVRPGPSDLSFSGTRPAAPRSVRVASASASCIASGLPERRGNSSSSVETSHAMRSATAVRSSSRVLLSPFATPANPSRRAAAAVRCRIAAGAAMVMFAGARTTSQPRAWRWSRMVPRREKCRSTNAGIRSRRAAK